MTEGLLVWVLAAPLAGAAAALAGKLFRKLEPGAKIVSTASLAVSGAVLAILAAPVMKGEVLSCELGSWPEPVGIALVLDGIGWVSAALTTVIAMAVAVFSMGRRKYTGGFFFFLMMLVSGMYGVALTGDLFTMFVCFEIIAVSVYVLIAWEGTATGLAASLKYLILSTTGILFFLLGIFLVYRDLGVLSLSMISDALAGAGGAANTRVMHLALASLCVGIGVRTAFIPFHTWLPEAHAYAPHPISAILSGALIKVSLFAMVRILIQFQGEYLFSLLMWIGSATALLAAVSAVAQSDAKRLLAYSSISQLGYMLAVFGAGSSIALTASFFHAVNHALFKALLFLTAGAAVTLTGERNLFRMPRLGGRMPIFAVAFFIGTLSISGIPPFNGFASKVYITQGMKGSPAYPLLWITGILTIASFIKLSRIFLPGRRTGETEGLPGKAQTAAVTALALGCVATGVFGEGCAGFLNCILYGEPLLTGPAVLSAGNVLKTLLPAALGVGMWRLVLTGTGARVSGRIRAMAPQLQVVLVFFLAGFLAFAAAAY